MKILLDTNVILDYALIRFPFFDWADQIFSLIEQTQFEGYVSASTFTDLYYIMRKPRGKEWTLNFLQELTELCAILPTNDRIIEEALKNHYEDFEDDVQYYTAVFNQLDAIITRNPSDFPNSSLSILTSEQLIEQFNGR